mmetsp:Transcript_23958/g.71638  ORF Transcript_23958/g.71638 Transcript_23958/m.71638 type:complete len:98 (-) Transcript_23958:116-409(-)
MPDLDDLMAAVVSGALSEVEMALDAGDTPSTRSGGAGGRPRSCVLLPPLLAFCGYCVAPPFVRYRVRAAASYLEFPISECQVDRPASGSREGALLPR